MRELYQDILKYNALVDQSLSLGEFRTKKHFMSLNIEREKMREDIINQVIKKVMPSSMLDEKTKYYINETGRFVIGGTLADSGLTGRKIIVDTYGGVGSHGGGCFSGKDHTQPFFCRLV